MLWFSKIPYWSKKILLSSGIIFALFVCVSGNSRAQVPSPPAGTPITFSEVFGCQKDAPNDEEWVEFYNDTEAAVDLATWKIEKRSESSEWSAKVLNGTVPAKGYLQIKVGAQFMNNTGFALRLKDSQGDIVEMFPQSEGTYEKCPSDDTLLTWIKQGQSWSKTTSLTPGAANILVALSTPTPTPTASPTPNPTAASTSTATPSPTPVATVGPQPTTVSLSEVSACQSEGAKEWVELYNSAATAVTLTNWKLTDDDNNDQPITSLTIAAKDYSVVEISKYSKGMLTNDGDIVNLFDATGKKVDSFEYKQCTKEQTWAKSNGKWQETSEISRGKSNPTLSASPSPMPSPSTQPIGDGGDGERSSSPEVVEGSVLGTQDSQGEEEKTESLQRTSKSSNATTLIALGSIGVGVLLLIGIVGYLSWEPFLKAKVFKLLRKSS